MKNINSAIEALQKEVLLLRGRANYLETKVGELQSLQENSGDIATPDSTMENTEKLTVLTNTNIAKYKDYPLEKPFLNRSYYIDSINQRPFRKKEREKLMKEIEGPVKAERIKKYISQDLKVLNNTGIYVAQKFNNDNKAQFYYRVEWLNLDGQNTTVKPEYQLRPEEFGEIPENKRKNFVWILPGAAS